MNKSKNLQTNKKKVEKMKNEEKKDERIKFIDLCCGIGGFHLALKELGGECVLACEIDKGCQEIYQKNFDIFPKEDIFGLDISQIPKFDILISGFPCQSFSQSGKQQGFADKTRGTIFFKLLEILKEKKPKYFILENVKNLISHDKGKTWDTIYNSLTEVGYLTYPKPIIASPLHFGVPQNRERVFIIGINKDLEQLLKPYPTFERQDTCLYDILQKDDEIDQKEMLKLKISDELNEVLNLWEEFVQYFKREGIKLPGFPIWTEYFVEKFDISSLPVWKGKFISQNIKFYNENALFLERWLTKARNCQHFKGSLTKLEWQCGAFEKGDTLFNLLFQLRPSGIRVKRINYSPALVAMAQVVYIGKLKRRLSSREVARLQSFPDSYQIHPNLNKCYKQFGNAVNVDVVKKIAEFLLK